LRRKEPMKQTLLTLIGLSLSLSFAQAPAGGAPTVDAATREMLAKVCYQVVSSPQDIATLYNVATSEILIAADAIVSEEVADTLRRAMVKRGVSIYILTREDTVDAPESYVRSLTAAGASVRVAVSAANFALVDREWAVVGPMAAGWPKVGVQEPLPLIDPELEAGTDLLTWFYDTAEERSLMREKALLAAQGGETSPTMGICEEQLAISSIAQLLMGTTLPSAPPATTPEDGTTSQPEAPALADPSCYAYAEPTGLTTLIMEPNYVYQLLDGYYQAFVAAEPYGG
jgi:hypothetical protein